jgi:hypothetical protein
MNASITNQNSVSFDDVEDEYVALDAEAAYHGVSALVEMLGACKPGEKVTGIFVCSLLQDVQAHLLNVVGGLRVPVAMASVRHQVQ